MHIVTSVQASKPFTLKSSQVKNIIEENSLTIKMLNDIHEPHESIVL